MAQPPVSPALQALRDVARAIYTADDEAVLAETAAREARDNVIINHGKAFIFLVKQPILSRPRWEIPSRRPPKPV